MGFPIIKSGLFLDILLNLFIAMVPENDIGRVIEDVFNKYTKIPLIMGRSDQYTLTTHMNPFDDIRKGSLGLPLNYVECTVGKENQLVVKTPYLPVIYENGEKKEYEWYDTHFMVKIIDNYYYAF